MKKVLIDLSVLGDGYRGMGFYTLRIITELIKLYDGNDKVSFLFYSNKPIDTAFEKFLNKYGYSVKIIKIPFLLYFNVFLPFIFLIRNVHSSWFSYNLVPFLKLSNTRYILTIHDLMFLQRYRAKTFYQYLGRIYRKYNFKISSFVTNVYTSVSRHSLFEIYQYVNPHNEKYINYILYSGAGDVFNVSDSYYGTLNRDVQTRVFFIPCRATQATRTLIIYVLRTKNLPKHILMVRT